jgi:hypothetical protein
MPQLTKEEIEKLATIRILPGYLQQTAMDLMIPFANRDHDLPQNQQEQAREIQSAGNILYWALSGQRLTLVYAEHQSLFGPASANLVRTMVGQFVTRVAEMARKDAPDVPGQ